MKNTHHFWPIHCDAMSEFDYVNVNANEIDCLEITIDMSIRFRQNQFFSNSNFYLTTSASTRTASI